MVIASLVTNHGYFFIALLLNVVSRGGRRRKYSTSVLTTTSSERVNTTLTRPQRGRLHLPFSCRPFEAPGGALELQWALGSYPQPCLSDSTGPLLTCLLSPRQSTLNFEKLTRHIYGVLYLLSPYEVTAVNSTPKQRCGQRHGQLPSAHAGTDRIVEDRV